MATIEQLAHVKVNEARRLRLAGIDSTCELWRRAALVPARPATDSLEILADATAISRDRLAELLAHQAVAEADACNERKWPAVRGLALHVGWCVIVSAALGSLYGLLGWPSRMMLGAALQTEAVVVARPDGLPAYHRVVAGDVAVRRVAGRAGAISSLDQIVGHLTLEPLSANSAIDPRHITPDKADAALLAGRTVLTLPLGGTAPKTVPPARVSLVLARRDGGNAVVLDDVVLLAVGNSGGRATATVALTQGDTSSAASALAVASAFIAARPQ